MCQPNYFDKAVRAPIFVSVGCQSTFSNAFIDCQRDYNEDSHNSDSNEEEAQQDQDDTDKPFVGCIKVGSELQMDLQV